MPKAFAGEDAATITQGQTTAVGADTQTEQPVLEGQVAEEQPQSSIWDNWLLWIVVAMWVWFLFGNKKRKAQREQEKKDRERRNALEKGDRVVTIGRMHGKVVAFTEKTVTIKPDDKSEYSMTFDREALLRVLPRPGEEPEEAAADGAAQS
jgi:preprotein translocase YajC subunit